MATDDGLRLSVSYARKVNLGNYESADIFVAVSNIGVETSDEDIAEALDAGHRAFVFVKQAVIAQSNAVRAAARQGGDR